VIFLRSKLVFRKIFRWKAYLARIKTLKFGLGEPIPMVGTVVCS